MTSVVVIRQTSAGIIQGVAVSCTLFMAHTTLKPRNTNNKERTFLRFCIYIIPDVGKINFLTHPPFFACLFFFNWSLRNTFFLHLSMEQPNLGSIIVLTWDALARVGFADLGPRTVTGLVTSRAVCTGTTDWKSSNYRQVSECPYIYIQPPHKKKYDYLKHWFYLNLREHVRQINNRIVSNVLR